MTKPLAGSCLCGGVSFEVSKMMKPLVGCHCAQCRKHTGHYWVSGAVLTENFRLTASNTLKWYQSGEDTRRGFCGTCGATMFFERAGAGRISFAAGSIDGAIGQKILTQVFTDEMGDYYDLPDTPECFAAYGAGQLYYED